MDNELDLVLQELGIFVVEYFAVPVPDFVTLSRKTKYELFRVENSFAEVADDEPNINFEFVAAPDFL